jgi:Dyp-type peroxidase family
VDHPIDWDDVQGNVLRGYGFDHGRHLVFRVDDPAAARRWLAATVAEVTPGSPWGDAPPATTLNLAFTFAGLRALGVPAAPLAAFPDAFRDGMRARAERIGDVGPDDPARWQPGGPHQEGAHVLVMAQAREGGPCAAAAAGLATAAEAGGLTLLHTEVLATLRGPAGGSPDLRIEHFGFADGISQPAVAGALAPTVVEGNGTYLGGDRWRPVQAGEFVFGYPDEEEERPPLPGPDELVRNGSFLVWRKLAQDVAGFRRLLAERGASHAGGPEMLAAQLVGRWPDGSLFGDDPGELCPVGSHVRRANPRGIALLAPGLVSRHRLLRRGMPYGPPLAPEATADDGEERGLLFLAYCADLARQFEFTQREWLNDGNAFGAGDTADPIAGHGDADRRFAVPAPEPAILGAVPRLVRSLGGAYLFQPGLAGLRHLAGQRGT